MPESLLDLHKRSVQEMQQHWALESITTDYGSVRYYLFAEMKAYRWVTSFGGWEETLSNFKSPWAAQALDTRIFADSRLSIFNFNRRVLYSARAGHADIIRKLTPVTSTTVDDYRVVGRHYYYDPVTQLTAYLGGTDVASRNSADQGCNLAQWGFEDR